MTIRKNLLMQAVTLASIALAQLAQASPLLPYYEAQTFVNGAPITNPYFPMNQGSTFTYAGEFEEEGEIMTEGFELSNIGLGKVLLGVQTWTQFDRAVEGDLVVEETSDYYAQDTAGNVWYFGEDVTNFIYDDDDNLVSTNSSSSWLAGENGAFPGIIMLGDPILGFEYFQEWSAADDALDHGKVAGIGETVTIGLGTYSNVVKILEGSVLDPEFREFKYYAPGVGLILAEEGLDANFENPELRVELVSAVPVPAALPLLFSAIAGLGIAGRRAKT